MIKMYLKRQFCSVGFWAIILALIAVTFFSRGMGMLTPNIYIIDSIFEEIVNYDTVNYMIHIDSYNSYNYLNYVLCSSYFYLALPLLTALFIVQFSDIKNNNFEKMIISRIGHKKFDRTLIFSLIIISIISAFIIVSIIAIIIKCSFPVGKYSLNDYLLLYLKKWFIVSVLLISYTSLTLLIVIITRNKFLSIVSCVLLMETFEVTLKMQTFVNSIIYKPRSFLGFLNSSLQIEQVIYIITPIILTILILIVCHCLLERRRENNE